METGFRIWREASGLLAAPCDPNFPCRLYRLTADQSLSVDAGGALFGYVASGTLSFRDANVQWNVGAGEWFATRLGGQVSVDASARAVLVQRQGYRGVYLRGGPLERRGRLRYIDGCSDTLLCAPPLLGDPCLNQLHFPIGTRQTIHTHPSARLGVISGGAGWCLGAAEPVALRAGDVFLIPPGHAHAFATDEQCLDVVAFHPDSDWGPTHEAHPMLNRTWVNGVKIDNTGSAHAAELIAGQTR